MHTGPIPFAKAFEATVKSCHQNGIRGGSATVNFAWFHYDILGIDGYIQGTAPIRE